MSALIVRRKLTYFLLVEDENDFIIVGRKEDRMKSSNSTISVHQGKDPGIIVSINIRMYEWNV